MAVLFLADRRFQRNRFLRDLHDLTHLVHRHADLCGDLFRLRIMSELLQELPRNAHDLVDRLDHVHRDADRTRLVGDGAGDGLPDPPGRISGELIALGIVEFLDRFQKAEVALLDQVEELHAAADIAFCDGNDQTKVGLRQTAARFLVALAHALGKLDLLGRIEQVDLADLLQIHADRVVQRVVVRHIGGLVELLAGDLLDVFVIVGKILDDRFKIGILRDDLDAEAFEGIIKLFDLIRIELELFKHVHQLFIAELFLLLAVFDQILDPLLFFFNGHACFPPYAFFCLYRSRSASIGSISPSSPRLTRPSFNINM